MKEGKKKVAEVLECSISELMEYIICPASYYISTNPDNRPPKHLIRHRMYLGLNDLTFRSLDTGRIDASNIPRIVPRIFEGLSYNTIQKDIEVITTAYNNLISMLSTMELTLTGSVSPFDIAYGGCIIKSHHDITVRDNKNNRLYPIVVDFSNTKYEPFYNPIIYRCHTVSKNMAISGTNTEVEVLSVMSGKRWTYDKKRYELILEASIAETLQMMKQECYPIRVTWACAGCYYRGICHKLIAKEREW